MAAWVWVLIAVGVVAVLAVVLWQALARRRTGRLQKQFGPEYDRAVGGADDKRLAEAELQARDERRRRLDIRPLSQATRVRYTETWRITQAQFVDDPRSAVATADSLIQSVMADRGYPVEDFEQRASDVSVDHPQVVEHYRKDHQAQLVDEPTCEQRLHELRAAGDEDVAVELLLQLPDLVREVAREHGRVVPLGNLQCRRDDELRHRVHLLAELACALHRGPRCGEAFVGHPAEQLCVARRQLLELELAA